MKATGIVRRIDDLGRVVIPKEIRRTMRIREGDPLEIFTDREGEVILKKYSPINELNEFASEYADSASSVLGCTVIITDTDRIIAVSGGSKKDFVDKRIHRKLEQVIQEKNIYQFGESDKLESITADGGEEKYSSHIVAPIVSQGDPIGAVVLMAKDSDMGEAENKIAEIGANFLARQMES